MPNESTGNSQDATPPADGAGFDEQKVAQLVNAAVTSQLKRVLPKAIADATAPLVEQFKTQIAEVIPKQPEQQPAPGEKKPDPELTAMARKVQEMERLVKSEREAREKAEKTRRDDKTFADLKQHLTDAKVRPEMVDFLAKVLFYADKRVDFDEDGTPLLRVKDEKSNEEQTYPLAEGVRVYVKQKAAEPFLPAPGGATSGGTAQQRRTTGGVPRHEGPPKNEDEAARRTLEQLQSLGLNAVDVFGG